METVKFRTISDKYSRYIMRDSRSLYDAYKNPSREKEKAWEYCRDLCNEKNGYDLSVIGNNTFAFSAGFRFMDDNNKEHFVYITPNYDREAIIDTKEVC